MASMHASSFGLSLNRQFDTYIGLHNPSHDSQWIWTDGSTYNYTNWSDNEPNRDENNEWCVQIFTDSVRLKPTQLYRNKWNDITCNAALRAFVCKSRIV